MLALEDYFLQLEHEKCDSNALLSVYKKNIYLRERF